MSCQLNGNSGDIPESSSAGGMSSSSQQKDYSGYVPPIFVSGWMYVNENGQMCGPYIQQQLSEGLSTGFLPEDLPVYPIVNGTLLNPVPLKYFKQFPDHIATGFAYLGMGILGASMPTNCFASFNMSSAVHGQESLVLLASQVTPCPDERLVSHSQVPYIAYSSNLPISNSKAENHDPPFPPLVLTLSFSLQFIWIQLANLSTPSPLYSPLYSTCLFVVFHAYYFTSSQGKIHVGCLRMMKGGNTDHILFRNFIPGVTMDTSGIH